MGLFKKKVVKEIHDAAWGHLVSPHGIDVDTLSREMAVCCCEIQKALERSIGASKDNTQAILNQMSHDKHADLLEKFNASQAVVSNLMQTNVLKDNNAAQTATILHHLAPFLCGTQNGNGHGNSSIVR